MYVGRRGRQRTAGSPHLLSHDLGIFENEPAPHAACKHVVDAVTGNLGTWVCTRTHAWTGASLVGGKQRVSMDYVTDHVTDRGGGGGGAI